MQNITPTKRNFLNNGHYKESQSLISVEDDSDDDDDGEMYTDQDIYSGRQSNFQMGYPNFSTKRKEGNCNCCGKNVWFVRDVCGIICAIFTWLLIGFADFVVIFVILLPSSYSFFRDINVICWNFIAILALSSHGRAVLSDPGSVPKGNATAEMIKQMGFQQGQVIYKCQKCCSIKPDRAHHCSVCKRCIKKMDHHCPWINNCVGENNQKYFVLFTFYIALISSYSLFLAVHYLVKCGQNDWKECTAYSPHASIIFLIFLIFESLLFGIFTAVMLLTQLNAIWHDETGIEQLKKEQARWERKSRWKSLQAVFGRFSIAWFNPFYSAPNTRQYHLSTYLPV